MTDRTVFHRWISLASALALLVAVLTSPLRPPTRAGVTSRPNCLRRNFAIPPTRSAYVSLKSTVVRTASVKAVRSEKKEDERLSRAARSARSFFGPPPSSSPRSDDPARAALAVSRAVPPLRC